ncbi:hypothetical protein Pmani_034087, partial [Petrolisthes manimaculis]
GVLRYDMLRLDTPLPITSPFRHPIKEHSSTNNNTKSSTKEKSSTIEKP